MSRELILEELKLFGARLKLFFAQAKDAPRMMWEGTSGTANLGERALLIITALLIVAGLVAYPVTFIRARWRSKLSMLFWTAMILLFLAVLFFFGTRNVALAAGFSTPTK